jgi:hypothetical protein
VPVDNVLRVKDIEIKTEDGKVLSFTDGCGRMSERLRNKVSKVSYGVCDTELD